MYVGPATGTSEVRLAVPVRGQVLSKCELQLNNDLRPRSIKQTNPYQTDKKQWAAQRKGITDPQEDWDHEGEPLECKRKQPPSPQTPRPLSKKVRLNTSTTTAVAGGTSAQNVSAEATSAEPEVGRVVLRTRFNEAPDAHRPITLKRQTVEQLFSELQHKWAKWLGRRSIEHCVVKFGWLGAGSDMFMFAGAADELQRLRHEVRLYLAKHAGECHVDVHVHVTAQDD